MTPRNTSTYSGIITTTIIIATPIDNVSHSTGMKYRSHNTFIYVTIDSMTPSNTSIYSDITCITTTIIIAAPIDNVSHSTGIKYRSILINFMSL